MGLNLTVQKGHDFSTGNVTRAALNAGATPTIAVTGSISGTELADGSVTNAKVSATAAIAASKLAVTENSIIMGDGNGKGSVLAANSDNDAPNGKLLADVGSKFALISTDLSAMGGDVGIQTVASGSSHFLKLNLNTGAVEPIHLNSNVADKTSIIKSSDGLAIKDGGVKPSHLATQSITDSNNNTTNLVGVLGYNTAGTGKAITLTAADQAAGGFVVCSNAGADPSWKAYNKKVTIGKLKANGWRRAVHGIKNPARSADKVPAQVTFALECTIADLGYAVGDIVYDFGTRFSGDGGGSGTASTQNSNVGTNFYADVKFVGFSSNCATFGIMRKNGAVTPADDTVLDGDNAGGESGNLNMDNWNVIAFVSE